MKLTKKILVAVLTLALLASCLMLSTFADDGATGNDVFEFNADGITKIDDLLEYYMCEDYLADAFEEVDDEGNPVHITSGDKWDYSQDADYTGTQEYYDDITAEIVDDPSGADNSVLKSELPYNKKNGYAMKTTSEVLTDKIFLTMDLYFEENCSAGLEFSIKVNYKSNGTIRNNAANLFKFSFRNTATLSDGTKPERVIAYTPWGGTMFGSTFTPLTNSEGAVVEPKTGVWYSLTLSFNAEDDVYYFELAEAGGETYRVEFGIPSAEGALGFLYEAKFSPSAGDTKMCATAYNESTGKYTHKNDATAHASNIENYDTFAEGDLRRNCKDGICRATIGATYYIDDIEIYEGSYTRNPARKDEITEITLSDLEKVYLNPLATREDKFLVAEVLEMLYNGVLDENGDYTLTPISDELKNVVPNAQTYMNQAFANEIVLRAEDIGTVGDYYDRIAYLADEFEYYNGLLCTNDELASQRENGITEEIEAAVIAARAKYDAEVANLAEIKTHSEGFIDAIAAYEPENRTYAYIVAIYEEVTKQDYAKRVAEYVGMTEAEEIYADIVFKHDRMVADVDTFVTAVEKMLEYAPTKFGELYAGYVVAYASYTKYHTDAVINPDVDNSSLAELEAAVASYEELAPQVVVKRDECNYYNNCVTKADIASYYPSLCELLLDADVALEVITGQSTDDFDELQYRMDYPGIADSKKTHEALTASLTTIVEASNAYIAAVNQIANATTLAEKQTAIAAAVALKADGDNLGVEGVKEANLALTAAEAEVNVAVGNSKTLVSIVSKIANATTLSERKALILEAEKYVGGATSEYEGVTAAITALETAKADFEADVVALNQAITNASEYVVTLS